MTVRLPFLAGLLGASLFAGSFALPSVATAQDLQPVPGTTVSLVPIEGWTSADGFAGFVNTETEASALVAELPAEAHPQLAPLFMDLNLAKASFASQGVEVEAVSTLTTADGGEVPLISGTQSAGGVTFDKWIALFEGDKTVMVTVQAPEGAELDAAAVEAMIASVILGDEPTVEEKIAALPFSVDPAEPFRVIDTIAGSGILMTAGPLDVDPDGTQPLLIVTMQISQPLPADQQEQIAETLLGQTTGFAGAEIDLRESATFAGGEGVLLGGTVGEGEAAKRFVQYFTIGDEGRFVRLIATADAAAFDEVKTSIETTAASVAIRD